MGDLKILFIRAKIHQIYPLKSINGSFRRLDELLDQTFHL